MLQVFAAHNGRLCRWRAAADAVHPCRAPGGLPAAAARSSAAAKRAATFRLALMQAVQERQERHQQRDQLAGAAATLFLLIAALRVPGLLSVEETIGHAVLVVLMWYVLAKRGSPGYTTWRNWTVVRRS